MRDLKAMAAGHAREKLQSSHNLLIDIVQQIRNEYTAGEHLSRRIESRIDEAFGGLQEGRDWVQALSLST